MRRTSDEYKADIFGHPVYVRFLDEQTIERESLDLLALARIPYTVAGVPVPVEQILENCLGFHLELDDLHNNQLLAATYAASRTVVIDQSLDPSEHPERLGRYRFTVAHEIGHIRLHWSYLDGVEMTIDEPSTGVLAGGGPLEGQADMFASMLLMPADAIHSAWSENPSRFTTRSGYFPGNDRLGRMASRFAVSRQAMKVRLERLGLLDK
jgi:hypothetical protein